MRNCALGCELKDTLTDYLCNGDVLCPSGQSRGKTVIVIQYLGGPHGMLSVESWKGLHHLGEVTLEGCLHLHLLGAGGRVYRRGPQQKKLLVLPPLFSVASGAVVRIGAGGVR